MPFPFWTICLIFNPFEVGMRFHSRKENIPFMMSSEYLALKVLKSNFPY